MTKNLPIIVIGLLLLLSSCKEDSKTNDSENKEAQRKPNIILIMADDQGWGDLSMNGNTDIDTPHIDALANNGVSFENFYVQPVCSPTRAELLTGRHFTRLGVHKTSAGGERMNLNETTLAEVLKQAGYQTAAYGKWHNGMQAPYHPNARGFDDYYGFTSGHWGNYFSPMLEHNGKIVKGNGFLVDDLVNHGMEFMTKNKENPFFLYLPLNTPHSPMQVPDGFWDRFNDRDLDLKYLGEESTTINHTKAALAMVENIDFNVGRVIDKLTELELEENTIVIYLSDNGPNGWRWNGNMRGRKGSTDEGGVRTPFLMQWKGKIAKNKTIAQIGSAIDIFPTLVSLAGVAVNTEKPLDGKSLVPLLVDSKPKWEDRLIFNHWNGKTSIRTQKYRLDNENRLYDIDHDRGQKIDLSEQFPIIVDSLRKTKIDWLDKTKPMTSETDDRPITLGHPDFPYTQIPARDGIPHGNIKRSNRYPNNTFFTNWKSVKDSITWDIDVLEDGKFEVEIYYTLAQENAGVAVQLTNGTSMLVTRIAEVHDPPLTGMENDRDPRMESYVKDFKPKRLGEIFLRKGRRTMTLKVPHMDGKEGPDVRLLMFRRLD
ncbi:arylsulfatase [Maribacter algarum]|uniref:Arylsulfatase n=1 Tax=Maribacter algarum (ex Zhang et al. 2020) TaxID=2578118 RepID=A0A5S3PPN2_9FLAO|nr:arylsulfatase [Maribacter algarum]TMM56672.1 arylsulfatase [Maribacter algarum]